MKEQPFFKKKKDEDSYKNTSSAQVYCKELFVCESSKLFKHHKLLIFEDPSP